MSRQSVLLAARITADPRWHAIVARDRNADGQFCYSVKTTGVYCRPSCGARPPRPENVQFHPTPALAEKAGFRPCKRCRPDEPLASRHAALVTRLCRMIETAETPPTLQQLARHGGMSGFHLHRVFKALTGVTPKAYALEHRGRRIRDGLRRGQAITQALYEASYGSSGRFYAESKHLLGMTPKAYRAGGANNAIRFGVGQCSLGALLVAATDRGICAILMGDDPDALVRDLQQRFVNADLIGADAGFEQWVAKVIGLVDTPQLGLDLPLDVRGTAFQRRVWQALQRIPVGASASYAEIARRIGSPGSARAVAAACAANALAVAIPCHRVVRSDGAIAGYRWGVERKRALLERETAADAKPSTRSRNGVRA